MYSQPGALSKDVLADLIAQIAALDMGKVRAELAEQEAEVAEYDAASSDLDQPES